MRTNAQKKTKDKKLRIFGVYIRIIDAIKHYDGVQTTYRTLSSTLLLSAFAAIGFLFSSKAAKLPFDKFIGVLFVCVTGLGALTILCVLDLFFQERLLIANFIEAIKLERDNKWLPTIHHDMLHNGIRHSAPNRKVFFYIGCSSCLIIFAGASLIYLFYSASLSLIILISLLIVFFIIFYSYFLLKITGRFDSLIKKILIKKNQNE